MQLVGRKLLITTDDTLLVAPPKKRVTVSHIVLCNTHTAAVTVRLHHLRPVYSETSGASNAIAYDLRVAANSTDILERSYGDLLSLEPTEEISGLESVGSKVCVSFYGRIGDA